MVYAQRIRAVIPFEELTATQATRRHVASTVAGAPLTQTSPERDCARLDGSDVYRDGHALQTLKDFTCPDLSDSGSLPQRI